MSNSSFHSEINFSNLLESEIKTQYGSIEQYRLLTIVKKTSPYYNPEIFSWSVREKTATKEKVVPRVFLYDNIDFLVRFLNFMCRRCLDNK